MQSLVFELFLIENGDDFFCPPNIFTFCLLRSICVGLSCPIIRRLLQENKFCHKGLVRPVIFEAKHGLKTRSQRFCALQRIRFSQCLSEISVLKIFLNSCYVVNATISWIRVVKIFFTSERILLSRIV